MANERARIKSLTLPIDPARPEKESQMISKGYRAYLPLSLGQVVATPGALQALEDADSTPMPYLIRHASGDWGNVPQEDQESNNDALIHGERIISSYTLRDGQTTIWIITEADRSATTILLPSEY